MESRYYKVDHKNDLGWQRIQLLRTNYWIEDAGNILTPLLSSQAKTTCQPSRMASRTKCRPSYLSQIKPTIALFTKMQTRKYSSTLSKLKLSPYWNKLFSLSTDTAALLFVGSRTRAYLKSANFSILLFIISKRQHIL